MKKALLIIDYIKGIAETGGCARYLQEHPFVVENTNKLIDAAKSRKDEFIVVFVRLAFDKNYTGLPKHAPQAAYLKEHQLFLKGQEDTDFIEALHFEKKTDIALDKKYGDPFYGSGLSQLLQESGVGHVYLLGVATDNAILYGASTAMMSGLEVSVIEDACGAPSAEAHRSALQLMGNRVVNEVINTDRFFARFKTGQ